MLVRDVNDAGPGAGDGPPGPRRAVRALPARRHDALASRPASASRCSPRTPRDVTRLLQLADVAMYQAKEDRTGVELYRPEQDVHTTDRLDLMGSVRRAIEQHELQMYFQPCVALPGGQPVGVEALVRWIHPERGHGDAGRVPRPGRADRADAPAHPGGARRLALAGRRVVGAAACSSRWPSTSASATCTDVGFAEVVDGAAAALRAPVAGPQAGDHRARPDGRPGTDVARPRGAGPARRGAQPRRLRHRLLVPGAPQAAAGLRDQGRPLVRRSG